jgi:bifunctional N-acetylglucosamine-1-phosphate-uridyltransferase/glucosamine-1-phosphate-acetyltransferase GlmU-like protein
MSLGKAASHVRVSDFVKTFSTLGFADVFDQEPWRLTQSAIDVIGDLIKTLGNEYRRQAGVAIHQSAVVESGSIIKAPALIGPNSFVAASAYLRGGVFLQSDCIVGPGVELKSTFAFSGSKLAHLNFVGDSILGNGVNCEAGSIIANYRNEHEDSRIRILYQGIVIDTGVDKFGAVVGDGVRIGSNAVVAPGALIQPRVVVPRLALVDQAPEH